MSDPYTPTRIMAQSAAQKAHDAYATARQSMARLEALEGQVADDTHMVAELSAQLRAALARIDDLEARQAQVTRRKAA